MWRLTRPWYADRLNEDWRPKTTATIERLFAEAAKSHTSTANKLMELLERRIDNIVFRDGPKTSVSGVYFNFLIGKYLF